MRDFSKDFKTYDVPTHRRLYVELVYRQSVTDYKIFICSIFVQCDFRHKIANISGNYTALNVFRYELFVGLLAFVTTPASSQDQVTALSGNVIFGSFFTVNELDNGDCGDYSAGHLEEVIAVTWFLKSLNDRNYIPGIKIGQKQYHDTEHRKFGLKLTVLSDGKADIPGIRTMASEP